MRKRPPSGYWAYVGTYECLVKHGYPTSDPPSLDEYIGSRGEVWHPYDEMHLTNQVPADVQLLNETCYNLSQFYTWSYCD